MPADTSVHAVWLTYDGGATWHESPINSGFVISRSSVPSDTRRLITLVTGRWGGDEVTGRYPQPAEQVEQLLPVDLVEPGQAELGIHQVGRWPGRPPRGPGR